MPEPPPPRPGYGVRGRTAPHMRHGDIRAACRAFTRDTIWIMLFERSAHLDSANLLVEGIASPEPAITEVDHAGVMHVRLVWPPVSVERWVWPKMVTVRRGDRRWMAVSNDTVMPLLPDLLLGTLAPGSGFAFRRSKRGTERKRRSANQRSREQSICLHGRYLSRRRPGRDIGRSLGRTIVKRHIHGPVTGPRGPTLRSGNFAIGRASRPSARSGGEAVAVRFKSHPEARPSHRSRLERGW
jgi:hypothetical protein